MESKYCPLHVNQFGESKFCCQHLCAWWDNDYDEGRCSIVTISKNLDYVADVCDGTRTLFVRNV